MGADTKANTRAAAHLRLKIIVSLRTAASAEAPSALMPLRSRLQGMGKSSERVGVSTGADTNKRTLGGGGALEHSDLRFLEDGGECSGALGSNVIAEETASEGWDGKR